MDSCWERSIPIIELTKDDVNNLFSPLQVMSYQPIMIGCRNSNYRIETTEGHYFLRICVTDAMNEAIVSQVLYEIIKTPKLLHQGKYKDKHYLIYEYIDGKSMQDYIVDESVVQQVAKNAALIHQVKKTQLIGFNEMQYPPYETWYDLFLDNPYAEKRLGADVISRIKKLVLDRKSWIEEIDSYQSFIHSDYRLANMIIDHQSNLYVVDFEYSGYGHTLADIGQFFRYEHCFNKKYIQLFESVYNTNAKVKLPTNWYNLAKLRELINPLQMIGGKLELPNKYQDLRQLILNALAYFKY